MNLMIFLFSYVSYFRSNLNNIKINNEYQGYDYRYPLNETVDTLEFKNNLLRNFLLVKLQDNNDNNHKKMYLLDTYKDILPEFDTSFAPNITSAGLLDDWNFNI